LCSLFFLANSRFCCAVHRLFLQAMGRAQTAMQTAAKFAKQASHVFEDIGLI
jgi:hypothetical protein